MPCKVSIIIGSNKSSLLHLVFFHPVSCSNIPNKSKLTFFGKVFLELQHFCRIHFYQVFIYTEIEYISKGIKGTGVCSPKSEKHLIQLYAVERWAENIVSNWVYLIPITELSTEILVSSIHLTAIVTLDCYSLARCCHWLQAEKCHKPPQLSPICYTTLFKMVHY